MYRHLQWSTVQVYIYVVQVVAKFTGMSWHNVGFYSFQLYQHVLEQGTGIYSGQLYKHVLAQTFTVANCTVMPFNIGI